VSVNNIYNKCNIIIVGRMSHEEVLYLLLLLDLLSVPDWRKLVYFMPRLLPDCGTLGRVIGGGGIFRFAGFFEAVPS
jgi:hypothetical protein